MGRRDRHPDCRSPLHQPGQLLDACLHPHIDLKHLADHLFLCRNSKAMMPVASISLFLVGPAQTFKETGELAQFLAHSLIGWSQVRDQRAHSFCVQIEGVNATHHGRKRRYSSR